MPGAESIFFIPEMSPDLRIRAFRRNFPAMEEFEEMEVDAYVVITDHYILVLDTLLCPEDVAVMMISVQDELAGRQVLCVNSHADWDHTYGNRYFTGEHAAPIIGHERCRIRMQSEEALKDLQDLQAHYPLFSDVMLLPPTLTFTAGMTIHGGDLTIELLPAPGHHLDQVVAWIPEVRLLLAFDAVEKPIPYIENAQCAPYMFATLESLIDLQPERVLCSHGKSTDPELVKTNLAYLREIERRCHTLLEAHRPSTAELEHPSTLINYPFDDAIAGFSGPIDLTFYSMAHENNIRSILEWLLGMS